MPALDTPLPARIPIVDVVRLATAKRSASAGTLPSASDLKAARAMLLAEYGPCAAAHPEILVAAARGIHGS